MKPGGERGGFAIKGRRGRAHQTLHDWVAVNIMAQLVRRRISDTNGTEVDHRPWSADQKRPSIPLPGRNTGLLRGRMFQQGGCRRRGRQEKAQL